MQFCLVDLNCLKHVLSRFGPRKFSILKLEKLTLPSCLWSEFRSV